MASKQKPKRKTNELQQLLSKTGRHIPKKPISPPPTSTALNSDIKSDTKSSPAKTRHTRRSAGPARSSKNVTVNSSPKPSSPFKSTEAPTLLPPSSPHKLPGSPSKKHTRHANLTATPSMRLATAKAKNGQSVFRDADALLSPRVGKEPPSQRGPYMKGAIVEDGPPRPSNRDSHIGSGIARGVSPLRQSVTQTYGLNRQSLKGQPKNNIKPTKAPILEEAVWDLPSSPQAQRQNAHHKMPPVKKSDPSIPDTASPPSGQGQELPVVADTKPNARQKQPPRQQMKRQEQKKPPPPRKAATRKRQKTPILISSDSGSSSDLTMSDMDESDEEFVPSGGAKRKRNVKEAPYQVPDRAPKAARTRRAGPPTAKKISALAGKSADAQKDEVEHRFVPIPIPPVTPVPIAPAAPVAPMSLVESVTPSEPAALMAHTALMAPIAPMASTAPIVRMKQSIPKSPEKAQASYTPRATYHKQPETRGPPKQEQYDSTPETMLRKLQPPPASKAELFISDFDSGEEGENEDEDDNEDGEEEEQEEAPKQVTSRAGRGGRTTKKGERPPSPLDIITKLLSAVDSSTSAPDPAPKKKRNSRTEKSVLSKPTKKQKTTYISTTSGIGDLSSLLRSKLQGTQSKKAKSETRKFLLETDELFTRRNKEFVRDLESESEKLANKLRKVNDVIIKRFDEFSHLNDPEASEAQTAKNMINDIRQESKRAMDIYENAQNGFKKHQAQVPVERWGKDWDEVDEIIELGEVVGEKIIKAHISAETEPGAAYKKLMRELSEKEKEVAAVLLPESLKELEEKSWGQAVWGLWDVLTSISKMTEKT